MKKLFFMAVAAIAALSSCTSDNELELNKNTGKEALTFTATMEDSEATRATYNSTNKCAAWEAGDQISINGMTYNAQSAGLTTTFKAATEGQEAEGPTYNAYFACTYDGATATLPAEISETWANGKFNMPMYANSETTSLKFYNLCGVLKITVTKAQLASVKCITVSSTNKAVSGKFTVSDKAAVLTDASNTANTVTVTYTDAVTTDATGKVFYVAVPAQAYKNLSIAVSDGTTTMVMTTKADQDIVVNRKSIYPITFNGKLVTTDAETRTEGTGTTDVKWIQLWEGGPKFAEYNVGATSVTGYGGLYSWGGTYKNGKGIPRTDDHNTDNTGEGNLTGTDDTATNLWGSKWRMPTHAELQALWYSENCTCGWRDNYNGTGVNGLLCTGKGAYSSNSVFLPAVGNYYYNGEWCVLPDEGRYWSSTPDESNGAYNLLFSRSRRGVSYAYRGSLYSVRAVLEEAASPAPAEGKINGHAYVDLGLSVKWATCNVGASSPEEYGDYYAWGETEPKSTYDWSTYKWCKGSERTLTKYCTDSSYGTEDNKTELDQEDDVAHVKWGGNWRMPTEAEMAELRENCAWTWTTQGGTNGCKVTSNKNGNSVFLPAAGYRSDSSLYDAGSYGSYWSSSLSTSYPNGAYDTHFNSDNFCRSISPRDWGYSVRPVCP